MTPDEILPWALRVLETERDDELQVFADLIIESGWYDERVVTICMMPAGKPPRRLTSSQRRKRGNACLRIKLEAPNLFHRCAASARYGAAESWRWVRAIAAVLLFTDWPTRPYGLLYQNAKANSAQIWSDVSVTFGGVSFGGITNISYTTGE